MALNLRRIVEGLLISVRELAPHAMTMVRHFVREQFEEDDILRDELLHTAEEEIRDRVRREILDENDELLEAEIRCNLRYTLQGQVIEDLQEEHRESVRANLREELEEDLRDEIKADMMAKVTENSKAAWTRQAEETFWRKDYDTRNRAVMQLMDLYKANAYKAIGLYMMANEKFRRDLELLIAAHRRIDEAKNGEEKIWPQPTGADLRASKRGIRKRRDPTVIIQSISPSPPMGDSPVADHKSNVRKRAANDDSTQPRRPRKRIRFDLPGEEPQVQSIEKQKVELIEGEFESSVDESTLINEEFVLARARGEVNQRELDSAKTWDRKDCENPVPSHPSRKQEHQFRTLRRLEGKGLFYPHRRIVSGVLAVPLVKWDEDSTEEQDHASKTLFTFEQEANALRMADEIIKEEKEVLLPEKPSGYALTKAKENRRKELDLYRVTPVIPRKRPAVDQLLHPAKRRRSL